MNTQTKTRERERESKSSNFLRKILLGALKGVFVAVFSVIAIWGIIVAVSTFARAGSLTPPGTPASTQVSVYEKTDIRGPRAMSAETAGTYTHANAAIYCYGLSAAAAFAIDGDTSTTYTDWRLPSAVEAAVFEGTITSANYIWTSTVCSTGYSWVLLRLSDGSWYYDGYLSTNYVRCLR